MSKENRVSKVLVQLRTTEAQRAFLRRAADQRGWSMTKFILEAALKQASEDIPEEQLDELVALAAQERGVTVEEFTRVMALEGALKILHDKD